MRSGSPSDNLLELGDRRVKPWTTRSNQLPDRQLIQVCVKSRQDHPPLPAPIKRSQVDGTALVRRRMRLIRLMDSRSPGRSTMTAHRLARSVLLVLGALALDPASAAVVTNASDTYRTGWYPDQASLTPGLVASTAFAQRFSTPIQGQVYAQPLVANNTLFVATEENWIYRLDPETGQVQWSEQVAPPWNPADIGCDDLTPWIGITGTPVIDTATNTAYFFSKTYAIGTSGPATWYAHAVDIITGNERPGFPVEIKGTAENGGQVFDATQELQRPGLLLLDGVVYAAFGGICDISPWQGWVVGVATSGQLKAMWTSHATLDGDGAAIWQSGGGLISDGKGRILFATGNGGAPTSPIPGSRPPADLGESVVRLAVQTDGTLQAADFFTPYDALNMDNLDLDLGSGGPMAFPDAYFGTATHPHLAIEVGKTGTVYMLDRDNLGGCQNGPLATDNVINEISSIGVWSRPSVWPGDGGFVYFPTNDRPLQFFQYGLDAEGKPTLTLAGTSSDAFGFGSSATIVTSNGTASGSALVWVIYMPDGTGANAELRAYDPIPSGGTGVLSYSAPVRTASKFNPPGAANGRIYVGARDGNVLMFGPTLVSLIVDQTTSAGSVHLQWSGGNAPYTLERAEDPDFKVNPTVLLDHQTVTSFDDPVLGDAQNYYYRVR
jgi:outer membrane protein assembly factor BamB